ncbi:hypothetical protein M1247_28505 [Mycobacterium sp. 21AC1]|uniref:hypothetical protein n=1 Tax=[Mycobacterium] appelbergii TaxID=2939269 RepID=UPI002939486E|nr:hypothetical protein [Mycobacterium sp. 21AC1]MDV3128880.1 hypothetical protein [Mycobacterium sp. 21AC1]
MGGRKRHFAEDIVGKLHRADELTAEGKTGEEIAADTVQLAPHKRLADAELEKDALREVARGKF